MVELRYRVDDVTPRNEFGNYFGEVVALQGGEPVANAEYVLITPKERTFYFDNNIPGLTSSNAVAGNQRIYRFSASSIPALNPEPSMPPWPEVLGSVNVSTYKNWDDLGRWYWGLIKDQFDLDEETRKLAKQVTQGKTTELEKVKAIYKWVTENTRYVALEFGIYGYKPRRCVQTVARGWGDCKDKATVIATLLKEVGIPSTIVVTRTRMRGDLHTKMASFAPFDHAIAYVPSLNLYLDGTAEHTGIYELPKMDVGAVVLQVNEGKAQAHAHSRRRPRKEFRAPRAASRARRQGRRQARHRLLHGRLQRRFVARCVRRRGHAPRAHDARPGRRFSGRLDQRRRTRPGDERSHEQRRTGQDQGARGGARPLPATRATRSACR